MKTPVAKRDDGVMAVVTHMQDGFAHGYLQHPDGTKRDWPLPLAAALKRGNWEPLPGAEEVSLVPPVRP